MTSPHTNAPPAPEVLAAAAEAAGRQIPPLWPLASQVAVNPYLGQVGQPLAEVAARLGRIGAGPVTMPREWYRKRLDESAIADGDLDAALAASPYRAKPATLAALKQAARQGQSRPASLPTLADLAAKASEVDWPGLVRDRIGHWAASCFDAGQALWIASQGASAWSSYRAHAAHDITPEIMGLKGFAMFVVEAPPTAIASIARSVQRLGLEEAALVSYFHQLLHSMGGWAQSARYRLWQAELQGQSDSTLAELLAIRLLWEEALYVRYEGAVAAPWATARAEHGAPPSPSADDILDEILQEAAERAAQRALADQLAAPAATADGERPVLQAAFCIDVRSEVLRRALEATDPRIRTLGFAGFFGIFARHRRFASDVEERHLPVLFKPTVNSCATPPGEAAADLRARFRARARRAWGRFKLAAVSSFAFVEAMGPVYGAKLLRDTFALNPGRRPDEPKPRFDPPLDLAHGVRTAESVLRGMSLTGGFARIVLLAGHGAAVVNNPHASALHCGACGGYPGEVNARLLASLLNDHEVRGALALRGLPIPDDTLFIAALHDTVTDTVALYDRDVDATAHAAELGRVRAWLSTAGAAARTERARRLPRANRAADIPGRARDWAEVRPEWGLAGCRAFIAAPRRRTAGRDLAGRCFLHDYDWQQDRANGFAVLELIMTAPVVVASWISLQYYGSTVAPDAFGAGNKLLHNVVGGIGVLEGNGGLLRGGLPWQSVHDGERYVHEPLRLSVCIEAPREAVTEILRRHDAVRALFDNRWLHLFALDETGRMAWRYAGDLAWQALDPTALAPARSQALTVA